MEYIRERPHLGEHPRSKIVGMTGVLDFHNVIFFSGAIDRMVVLPLQSFHRQDWSLEHRTICEVVIAKDSVVFRTKNIFETLVECARQHRVTHQTVLTNGVWDIARPFLRWVWQLAKLGIPALRWSEIIGNHYQDITRRKLRTDIPVCHA